MKFSAKAILSAVTVLAVSLVNTPGFAGCHRSGGYSRSYSYSSYGSYRPAYTPRYSYSYSQPARVIRPVQPVQPVQPVTLATTAGPQQQLPPQQQQLSSGQLPQGQAPQQPLRPVGAAQPPAGQSPTQVGNNGQQNTGQLSALQALAGFAPQPAAAAPQAGAPAQVPAYVGTWKATLGNSASVTLSLNADGSFTWTAVNQSGKASSFSGTYSVSNGNLQLTRSNDNQQLAGSMSLNGSNAFSFKLAGTNAAAISFSRS